MHGETQAKYRSLYCVGISFHDAGVDVRGRFSFGPEGQAALLQSAFDAGIKDLFVISTCNRSEIYGFAENPFQLISLLCEHTKGTLEEFQAAGRVFKNNEAVSHMFKVGAGLDSQILGDFEIISQLRQGLVFSKDKGLNSAYLERLVDFVVQASKRIKNETEISSGATSVAYASVQYIQDNVADVDKKNILLFGTGAIGRNTCENLIKQTGKTQITLVNRSQESAEEVAGKFDLTVEPFENLSAEITTSDILIVATGAQEPTVLKSMVEGHKNLLILDMSIPANVETGIGDLDGVRLVHLDELSQITDQAIAHRRAQLPQAEQIIAEVEAEFNAWLATRKFAPVVKALRAKLSDIAQQEALAHSKKTVDFDAENTEILLNRVVQKLTNRFANYLRENQHAQSESINLISSVFQLGEPLDE